MERSSLQSRVLLEGEGDGEAAGFTSSLPGSEGAGRIQRLGTVRNDSSLAGFFAQLRTYPEYLFFGTDFTTQTIHQLGFIVGDASTRSPGLHACPAAVVAETRTMRTSLVITWGQPTMAAGLNNGPTL